MPIYQFECNECECRYDKLTSWDDELKFPGIKCPECQSENKTKLLSQTSVIFKNPEGTDKWNSHSYRFGHKAEQAQEQRRQAEEGSHVGRNPYKDDPTAGTADIDSGKHFGEVK